MSATSNRCPQSGKVQLYTRSYAEQAQRDIAARNGHPMWIYECSACGYYHLTSRGQSRLPGYNYTPPAGEEIATNGK